MTTLRNHPGKWLSPAAEASLARFEAAHGVIPINSAGRLESEQNDLIHLYYEVGGAANRPPHLFAPARPARASRHVFGGGVAIDTSGKGIDLMHAHGEEYGWYFNFAYDKVHFEYEECKDLHRGPLAPSGAVSQTVKAEQAWLNKSRGERLTVDGISGAGTRSAIARYQTFLKKYGYSGKADGIWGPGTQKAHQKYYDEATKPPKHSSGDPSQGKRPTIKKGDKGTQVRILQERLNGRYPAYSKLKNDAVFGAGTENVVKEFQRRAKLTPDGIVGEKTWAALGL